MIEYATLARTPRGALTAASKRAVEAERDQLVRQAIIDRARWSAFSNLRDQLIATSEQMEAEHPGVELPIGPREDAQYERGLVDGLKDGADNAKADYADLLMGALDRAEHRIHTLGLDTDLTTLELIERLRREIAA
jgi:hypothetical protein